MICELIEGKIKLEKKDIKSIQLHSKNGSIFSIYQNHEPFVSAVGKGNVILKFKKSGNLNQKKEVYFIKSGIIKIKNNIITLLSFGNFKKIS